MIRFRQFLKEKYLDTVKQSFHGVTREGDAFENPNSKELTEIFSKEHHVGHSRGLILDENTVILAPGDLLHHFMITHFKLRSYIPIELYGKYPSTNTVRVYYDKEAITKGNKFSKMKTAEIDEFILNNTYLKKMFDVKIMKNEGM